MGKFDSRNTKKTKRRREQVKKKARLKRAAESVRKERANGKKAK